MKGRLKPFLLATTPEITEDEVRSNLGVLKGIAMANFTESDPAMRKVLILVVAAAQRAGYSIEESESKFFPTGKKGPILLAITRRGSKSWEKVYQLKGYCREVVINAGLMGPL